MHAEASGTHAGKTAASADAGFKGFVESQLTWDRAMAEGLSRAASPPGSTNPALVVGIMGSGHIRHGHGVPHQLGKLGVSKVASLLPVSLEAECRQLDAGLATAVFILPNKPMPPSEPPRLGVVLEDAAQGLKVSAVTAGSLAEKTGLRVGDRIVEISGRPASGSSDAVATIRRQPPGTWLPLRVARGDSQLDLVVQFPPRP
jgi:S1-C subfamily serine protease